jgi:regulator of sirC expression with transglutaminase-like and TPR domain
MNGEPPAPEELDALLRLLDDETPAVRARVAERMSHCGGDISEWLAAQPRQLSEKEKQLLAEMLSPPRREILVREWIVPTGGAAALGEDWDSFEALLRALSDFLHDGITLRQPLSDALDLLAEEAVEAGVASENKLRAFLFASGRLRANKSEYYDPRNSDLAWSIAEGHSNPLGLCIIFILVARRMNLEVEGVNFPGHFLCRIYQDGFPVIIDCFDKGRLHLQSTLLESGSDLSPQQKEQLRRRADPGTILIRLLNNLAKSLEETSRPEDAALILKLRDTLG